MPAGQPHGLFYHDDLVWVFPSLLAAAKAFGFNKTPRAMQDVANDTVYSQGKYSVRKITKDIAETCPIDMTRLDDVKDLIMNNKDWVVGRVEQSIQACNKCGIVKPFTREYFRYEDGHLRSTCRECRNKVVADRTAKITKGVQDRIKEGQTTFKCSGGGINAAHDAPLDMHIGDRDVCRKCYNARRSEAGNADVPAPKRKKLTPTVGRKTRRHVRIQKDGVAHEFASKTAAAEFLGVTEGAIRFGLKNNGMVRGCVVEEYDG